MSSSTKIISWVFRIVVALIFIQTLFFKFSGAEETKYIFTTLMGAQYEAFGRVGSGVAELIATILLLVPKTTPVGALLALGVISGAIFSHLTKLGFVVMDDGGTLFIMALVVFVLSAIILYLHRRELPIIGGSL